MAKRKSSQGCTCIDQANKQLAAYNTRIPREMAMNFKTGTARMVLCIPTEKIDPRKREPRRTVFASHCPICGKKLERIAAKP